MELTSKELSKLKQFLKTLPDDPQDNRPVDRGEVVESHYFLIPRFLPDESNSSRKRRIFWLTRLNVRVRYYYSYQQSLGTGIDDGDWYEKKQFIAVTRKGIHDILENP
jgi:uncharacterized protein YaaN involved in tellurite resistance